LGDLPHSDDVVGVARVERLTIGRPGQRDALRDEVLLRLGNFGFELVDDDFVLQIPNLDGIGGGSAQPVSVGREAQSVDDVARIEGVQVLVVVQVPEHSLAVFASRSAQRTVWRNSHRVQVAVVAEVVGLQLAVGQVPDLHGSVPAARDDDRVGDVRRESHARYPITVRILSDGVFALSESVPQLDGLVSRARHDLTIVGREGNAEHVSFVVVELSSGLSLGKIPQSKSTVPRSGQAELTVGRDDSVGDEVAVALQCLVRNTARSLVFVQLPNDQTLISRSGENHIWEIVVGGDLSDPSVVALQGAFKRQLLVRHAKLPNLIN